MGCSAAKNLAVEPFDGDNNVVSNVSNGHVKPPRIAPEPEIPDNVNRVQKSTNGLSFEIGFEEAAEKPPPKRLQQLEEAKSEQTPETTLEKLQEKLDEAEIRRQQILQQRVQSAKYRHNLRKQASIDEDEDHLKVPQTEQV